MVQFDEDKNTKINIVGLIISIIVILILIIAGTYAWLTYQGKKVAMVLTIKDMNKVVITLKPYQINTTLSPMLTYTSLDNTGEYVTVKVENNENTTRSFELYYDIKDISPGLQSTDFKYTIVRTNDNEITEGNFAYYTNNKLYILNEDVPPSTTYYYKVYLWLYSDGNQSGIQGNSFEGELRAKIGELETLLSVISKDAVIDNIASDYVTNVNGVQFNDVSSDSNGKGVYLRAGTENDIYPIYYYRGDIDNNHVLFANFCWRIVRTTDTGGVKLLYDGVPLNGECDNRGITTHISTTTTAFNTNYKSPANVGYMYGTRYEYSSAIGTNWYYAPDVTYANGTYTLVANYGYGVVKKSTISGTYLNYQHYTCGSATATTCTSVKYVYYVSGTMAYYITLTNGKKVEDALAEMFTNSSNGTNSTIKTAIDTWYLNNMTSYTSYLEDEVYCNDRSISSLGGWNPDGGSATTSLRFNGYNRAYMIYTPSLKCTNKNDAFTVRESDIGNGKLTYPVGLLTSDEAMLAGMKVGNGGTNYLYDSTSYWLGSPYYLYNSVVGFGVSGGTLESFSTLGGFGVRVSVSLKLGTQIFGGSGTSGDPYIVE